MAATPAMRKSARSPGLAVAAAAAALLVGAVAENAALGGDVWGPWLIAVDTSVGVATVLAGMLAWMARPDSRAGPALVAIGGLWFLGAFGYGTDMALVDYVGFPLQGWHDVLLVALLLAVTPGGLRERPAQVIAAGALASHALLALARLLLRPPLDLTSCLCVPNRITGVTDPRAYETTVRIASIAEAGFALAALVVVGLRWHRASAPRAARSRALLGAAVATTALVTYNRVATRVVTAPVEPAPRDARRDGRDADRDPGRDRLLLVRGARGRVWPTSSSASTTAGWPVARLRCAARCRPSSGSCVAEGTATPTPTGGPPRCLRPATASRPRCSSATGRCWARSSTTPPCVRSPSCWTPSRPPPGSRSTTSGSPPPSARSSTRSRPRDSGSSPRARPSAPGSNATSTTAPSSGSSPSPCACAA